MENNPTNRRVKNASIEEKKLKAAGAALIEFEELERQKALAAGAYFLAPRKLETRPLVKKEEPPKEEEETLTGGTANTPPRPSMKDLQTQAKKRVNQRGEPTGSHRLASQRGKAKGNAKKSPLPLPSLKNKGGWMKWFPFAASGAAAGGGLAISIFS